RSESRTPSRSRARRANRAHEAGLRRWWRGSKPGSWSRNRCSPGASSDRPPAWRVVGSCRARTAARRAYEPWSPGANIFECLRGPPGGCRGIALEAGDLLEPLLALERLEHLLRFAEAPRGLRDRSLR